MGRTADGKDCRTLLIEPGQLSFLLPLSSSPSASPSSHSAPAPQGDSDWYLSLKGARPSLREHYADAGRIATATRCAPIAEAAGGNLTGAGGATPGQPRVVLLSSDELLTSALSEYVCCTHLSGHKSFLSSLVVALRCHPRAADSSGTAWLLLPWAITVTLSSSPFLLTPALALLLPDWRSVSSARFACDALLFLSLCQVRCAEDARAAAV